MDEEFWGAKVSTSPSLTSPVSVCPEAVAAPHPSCIRAPLWPPRCPSKTSPLASRATALYRRRPGSIIHMRWKYYTHEMIDEKSKQDGWDPNMRFPPPMHSHTHIHSHTLRECDRFVPCLPAEVEDCGRSPPSLPRALAGGFRL